MVGGVVIFSIASYDGRVNKANYERIREGMMIQEVQDILGTRQPIGRPNIVSLSPIYEWRSDSFWGNKSIVVFTMNDRVTGKSQAGLE